MLTTLKKLAWLLPVLFILTSQTSMADSEFPGRAKYPAVPVLSKAELKQRLSEVVVVDARSSLEFDTLKIKGAVNIPVASKTFTEQVKALRAKNDKPIVFYCNGRTCMKSYKAVKACKKAQIENTFAYDAGMFEWAKTYPDHAEILGHSPVREHDIISKTKFQAHNLPSDTFFNKVHELGSKSLVLDVRDKYQRGAAGFFPGKERWASLDERAKLDQYLQQAHKENRAIFIYDEVGKQVRWLQYALERANIKNYYFMEAGAKGHYQKMMSEFGFGKK